VATRNNERGDAPKINGKTGRKIELDLSPVLVSGVNTPGKAPTPAENKPASKMPLQGLAELHRKLNAVALTRPEKMRVARSVISSNASYPPDELLNHIADLLAIHFEQ
jgi:hypothetical protein